MESRTIFKIGLGLGCLYFAVVRAARGLIVGLQSYYLQTIDLANKVVQLKLNLQIRNPFLIGVKIRNIVGDLYIQGKKVGGVNTTLDYYIAGGKTHVLPVVVNLNTESAGQAIWTNILSGDINALTIAFNGKLYVSRFNIAVPLQIEYNVKDLF